jgi:GTP cyclohydrolase IA
VSGRKDRRGKAVAVRAAGRPTGVAAPAEVSFDRRRMEEGIRLFLQGIGPIVPAAVLHRTPKLVAEAWSREFLSGYGRDEEPFITPLTEEASDTLAVVRGIRFVSICRHHLLPFQGTAAVAYLPDRRLAGFSSVSRLVDRLARRLQIQEDLSEQIVEHLEQALSPRGVACLLEATHQCMTCRGAMQPDSRVTTLRVRGIFEREPLRRQEVLTLLRETPGRGERNG